MQRPFPPLGIRKHFLVKSHRALLCAMLPPQMTSYAPQQSIQTHLSKSTTTTWSRARLSSSAEECKPIRYGVGACIFSEECKSVKYIKGTCTSHGLPWQKRGICGRTWFICCGVHALATRCGRAGVMHAQERA
eukprot:1143051-Pelagomonas_calceolata.AAC.2